MVDVFKSAVLVSLEQHHLVRPDAPFSHLLAKTFRYGAEILADHNAPMRDAFLRRDRKQRLKGHLHIDAIVGAESLRNEIEPLQAEYVVEPDRACMPHRGAQHVSIRLEGPDFQAGGIEAGEPPVLTRRVQQIRRGSDGELPRDRDLLVPGIEAIRLHAHSDVQI